MALGLEFQSAGMPPTGLLVLLAITVRYKILPKSSLQLILEVQVDSHGVSGGLNGSVSRC